MPRIPTYGAGQVATPGPIQGRRAVAEDFGGGAFAGDFGRQLGSFADVLAQREDRADVSNISAALANAQAEQGAQLQEMLRTADPADPDVPERFLEQFDAYTGKLRENVKTRAGGEYFDKTIGTLRGHFLGRAMEGQADLAAVSATANYNTILNQQSSALINDPSAFQLTLGLHNESLDTLVAVEGLSRAAAEQLKTTGATELAKAAVIGLIKVNPEAAKDVLESGEFDSYIQGTLKAQLDGQADQAINAQRIEAERARAAAERAKAQAQMAEQNNMLTKLVDGELTAQDIIDSGLDPFGQGGKSVFLSLLEQQSSSGDTIKTDPAIFVEVWRRTHLPDGDPNKIVNENDLNALVGNGLTVEDVNTFRTEMQGSRTSAGAIEDTLKNGLIQAATSALTGSDPLLGLRDPKGDEQLQKFMAWMLPEYERLRKEGKSPLALTDPESPDYLGKAISRYTRSRQQFLQDLLETNPDTLGAAGVAAPTTMAVANPPGLIQAGNIDILNRPRVTNADGSISTVRSISFELDGQQVLLPTVTQDGRLLSTKEEIVTEYRRTGQFLGKFDTTAHATQYADALHKQQATAFGPGSSRSNPATIASQEDFDALAVGDWFVNPADGKIMQKAR